MIRKSLHTTALLLFALTFAQAQYADIPMMRRLFHENIDKSQKQILAMDGKADELWSGTKFPDVNLKLSRLVTDEVDRLQNKIEKDPSFDNTVKMKFLRGLGELVDRFHSGVRNKSIQPIQFESALDAFNDAMRAELNNQSIFSIVEENEFEIGSLLLENFAFSKNPGVKDGRDALVLKQIERQPARLMPILVQHPDIYFADSAVKAIAYRDPETIYTYAKASNGFARRIASNKDSLVRVITRLSKMKTGRQYFPFLDELYKGAITMEEIDASLDDDIKYYKLLVKTQIDYSDRMRQLDTPMVSKTLTGRLRTKAVDVFVNEINRLHDKQDAERFKILTPLTPAELYYLPIMGEEEIYTSSYLGVYKRIWEKMKEPKADTLLMNVRFDHFKKFIKMAAAYNTLDDFLKRMDKANAEILMRAFVNGLDRTGDLEDAVDVADSYASIRDKELNKLILDQVQENLAETKTFNGKQIYNILNTLFLSADSSNKIDVYATLGIPPVYMMPNKSLQDSSGRIIMQQFFYGDKDGKTVFGSFLRRFTGGGWKVTQTPQWVAVSSVKGTPITIYANKPLDEEKNLDAEAQEALNDYLAEKNLNPTVVIHRGHSYYTASTIKQLAPSAKVVFLGSCGGYHSLDNVLQICPTAHIIASKQIGSGLINQPLLDGMAETLREGKDLNWPQFWSQMAVKFAKNELFDDYVPPHRNLGAIFIMAYKKAQGID
jgi:hypothetical protein